MLKYKEISKTLFIKNRNKFIKEMLPNSISLFYSYDFYSIFYSNYSMIKNQIDLFYLCGFNKQQTILLIFPDAKKDEFKEILFIRKITKEIKLWEGDCLSKKQVRDITGIKNIYWIDNFNNIILYLLSEVNIIYLNLDKLFCLNYDFGNTLFNNFIRFIKYQYPLYIYKSSNRIINKLRLIKENEELACIQKAVSITEKGFKKISTYIKPNIWEFEIEAILSYQFIKNGSKSFAYNPIIASGTNTNILHYNLNNKQCKVREILLIDVGAKYANYCSDITRVFPVNGKFSKRQKEVYEAVLNIKKYAESLLIVGNSFRNYNIEIKKKVIEELFKIKLLNKNDLSNQDKFYKKFCIHSISHHLGLNTHDPDFYISDKFKPNMVFTIEPGIYIPNENIGIRLEDTYIIQNIGLPINLTKTIPIEYEEIELYMQSS